MKARGRKNPTTKTGLFDRIFFVKSKEKTQLSFLLSLGISLCVFLISYVLRVQGHYFQIPLMAFNIWIFISTVSVGLVTFLIFGLMTNLVQKISELNKAGKHL
jgi:uncharacterized protein with PQ loop repeat